MPARKKETMVAREACVITVGARPIRYGTVTVVHNKTGETRTIPNQNVLVDEGDLGVSYAFKAFQKVNPNHPAVLDAPGCFIPLSEVEESDLDSVTA